MPFHRFYTPKGLYSDAEKAALAQDITALYTAPPVSLPAFYVVVSFIELDQGNFFVGAETKRADNMVRIQVEHVARTFPVGDAGITRKREFMARYEETLKPYTAGRGVDWEIGVEDADPQLWHINGMSPPAPRSEEETLWKKENRAIPYVAERIV
ncbi:unnamed protein product [Mycena citricolor]|uniref:Tautomerase cis-CaaD-like domain-containing protein n=1 Tax=Mycena citricolor TaxID=2018698 RepID=A0AAD2K1Z7_9AGAR|nr:unnamed protein product [Mycena citricolor]CAK5276646.1 unnamed protein product [Mycena citricolor]